MAIYKSNEKTKDGRQWYYRLYVKDSFGNNKQIKSKKFATKAEALEAEALIKLNETNPSQRNFHIIAKDFFEDMYKKRKESTVYCYENIYNKNIKPYFEQFNINNINLHMINNWKDTMVKNGFTANYMNKLYCVFNSIMKYAVKNYDLKRNYVEMAGNFETPHEDIVDDSIKLRYITFEQFKQFISVIEDKEDYAIFNTLYYTGMRKGELQALSWKDIDLINDEIIINKTLTNKTKDASYKLTSTKNNVNRVIKISKTLKEVLVDYKNYMKTSYIDFIENWFVFGSIKPISENTIRRHKDMYFEIAQLDPITIHEFRHSHVSLLINEYIRSSREKGSKVDTAKFFLMMSNRMGHTIEVMTKTYMHLFPTIQDEIVDLLDNL